MVSPGKRGHPRGGRRGELYTQSRGRISGPAVNFDTRALWEGWRAVSSPQMKADYQRLVDLANEGSRELGYADTGALWRSWYDMPPEAFAAKTDELWNQVKPLYGKLECYVRSRLSQ